MVELLCEFAFAFVTRTSKNAFCPLIQKLRARMSSLASALVLALLGKCSLVTCWRGGSVSTSLQTWECKDASKSQMLSCLAFMNPPRLQFIAWVTLKLLPQTHTDGRPDMCLLYLTGLHKNFEAPTQIDQLVPIVLTGFSIPREPTTGTNWYMVSGTNRCPLLSCVLFIGNDNTLLLIQPGSYWSPVPLLKIEGPIKLCSFVLRNLLGNIFKNCSIKMLKIL